MRLPSELNLAGLAASRGPRAASDSYVFGLFPGLFPGLFSGHPSGVRVPRLPRNLGFVRNSFRDAGLELIGHKHLRDSGDVFAHEEEFDPGLGGEGDVELVRHVGGAEPL